MADGTRFKARPTTYNGIEMRSRLEAKYAAWLDRVNIRWTYEPKCYASEAGQYLPDFELHGVHLLGVERTVFVEVKPTVAAVGGKATALNWCEILWATHPGAFLLIEVAAVHSPVVFTPAMLGRGFSYRGAWVKHLGPQGARTDLALTVTTTWREVA